MCMDEGGGGGLEGSVGPLAVVIVWREEAGGSEQSVRFPAVVAVWREVGGLGWA